MNSLNHPDPTKHVAITPTLKTNIAKGRALVSYSRTEKLFTEKLHATLLEHGYEAFLDIHDIAPGEDWKARLNELILAADTVIFVLTNASLQSKICRWEVERTFELGKRLIPLAHGPCSESVPERLSSLNYIFSDAPASGTSKPDSISQSALEKLKAALDVDIAWVREHSRLVALTNAWAQAAPQTRDDKLLRRGEVDAAKAWKRYYPGTSAPQVPNAVISYVEASDIFQTKLTQDRQRIIGHAFVKPIQQALMNGRPDAALRLAAAGSWLADDLEMNLVPELGSEGQFRLAAFNQRIRARLAGHKGSVTSATFSPDGTRILTSGLDDTARIWCAKTGVEITKFTAYRSNGATAAKFSPDGLLVVICLGNGTVIVWNPQSNVTVANLIGHTSEVNVVKFNKSGTKILTASHDKTARIWDTATGKERVCLSGHERWIVDVNASHDFSKIVTSSWDSTARIWDASSGNELFRITGHKEMVHSASFSPDGRWVVTASHDRTARIWDANSGIEIRRLEGHEDAVCFALFSPDGSRIATASNDTTARVWDAVTGTEICCLRGHTREVSKIAFSPDGGRIISGSYDHTASLWDAQTGVELVCFNSHEYIIGNVEFCPHGYYALSTSGDGSVFIWDTVISPAFCWSKQYAPPVSRYDSSIKVIAFSPDNSQILGTYKSIHVVILDANTGMEIKCLQGHQYAINSATYSNDGNRIITASVDQTARIWNCMTGRAIATLIGHSGWVFSASFDNTGQRALTASHDGTARIWHAETGLELACLDCQSNAVTSASFSASGRWIATVSADNAVRVWDAFDYSLLSTFIGHTKSIRSAMFSPDEHFILSTSEDGSARLWHFMDCDEKWQFTTNSIDKIDDGTFSNDGRFILIRSTDTAPLKLEFNARVIDAKTGELVSFLDGRNADISRAYFSQDGKQIFSTNSGQIIQIWDTQSGHEIARLHEGNSNCWIAVSFDGTRIAMSSSDGFFRILDVERAQALTGSSQLALVAALATGCALRTNDERSDLLMRSVPDDLFKMLVQKLDATQQAEMNRRIDLLCRPMPPNCYLAPSQVEMLRLYHNPSDTGIDQ